VLAFAFDLAMRPPFAGSVRCVEVEEEPFETSVYASRRFSGMKPKVEVLLGRTFHT
jgi:hypothetical protein